MVDKFMEKYVKALESGKYKQGFGRLRRGNAFCALGVACDVKDPSGWKWQPVPFSEDAMFWKGREWSPVDIFDAETRELITRWNDREKLGFGEIAARLRKRFSTAKSGESSEGSGDTSPQAG